MGRGLFLFCAFVISLLAPDTWRLALRSVVSSLWGFEFDAVGAAHFWNWFLIPFPTRFLAFPFLAFFLLSPQFQAVPWPPCVCVTLICDGGIRRL